MWRAQKLAHLFGDDADARFHADVTALRVARVRVGPQKQDVRHAHDALARHRQPRLALGLRKLADGRERVADLAAITLGITVPIYGQL